MKPFKMPAYLLILGLILISGEAFAGNAYKQIKSPQEYIAELKSLVDVPGFDYNRLLIMCSDWADSNGKDAVTYRDECVAPIYNAYMHEKLEYLLDLYPRYKHGLSDREKRLIDLADPFESSSLRCKGIGNDRAACMEKAFLDISSALEKELVGDRYRAMSTLDEIRIGSNVGDFTKYAGYPSCQEIMDLEIDENTNIVSYMVRSGYLEEGVPYKLDFYGVGPEIMSIIQEEGWSVRQAYELPTKALKLKHNAYSESRREKPVHGCFPQDTEVVRLENDGIPVRIYEMSPSLSIIAMSKLEAKKVKIKDIKTGDVILSSTVVALLNPRFQVSRCWARVMETFENTLGYFEYDGFYEFTYEIRGHGGETKTHKIMATPEQGFYSAMIEEPWYWYDVSDRRFGQLYLYNTTENLIQSIIVSDVKKVSKKPDTKIYNLNLPTFVYLVGEGILTHNEVIKW